MTPPRRTRRRWAHAGRGQGRRYGSPAAGLRAARRRREPRRPHGRAPGVRHPHRGGSQGAIALAKTRPRHLAQGQDGGPGGVASPATPGWRGGGMRAARSGLGGATHPPSRPRGARGRGTPTASGAKRSRGERLIPVGPSAHGRAQRSRSAPGACCASRASDRAPLAVARRKRSNGSRRGAGSAGGGGPRNAVATGTVGAWAGRRFPCLANACAAAAPVLPGAFAPGHALGDRGRPGAGAGRVVGAPRGRPGGHRARQAGGQLSPRAERADAPPTARLEHGCNVGLAGRLTLAQAGGEPLGRAIEPPRHDAPLGLAMPRESTAAALAKRP